MGQGRHTLRSINDPVYPTCPCDKSNASSQTDHTSIVSCHSATKECVKAVIGNKKVFQFTIRTCVDEVTKLFA